MNRSLPLKLAWPLLAILLPLGPLMAQEHSIVRQWNDQLLGAISRDFARPPIHARNLYTTSAAMYDAWAAYDPTHEPFLLGRVRGVYDCPFNGVAIPATTEEIEAARHMAISYTMYRMISQRFASSPGVAVTMQNINNLMASFGYDVSNTSTDYINGGAAELGNYVAQEYVAFGFTDGCNQANNYANLNYTPINPPIEVELPGNPNMTHPNNWQQITLTNAMDQAGNPVSGTPNAIGHNWGLTLPFALKAEDMTMYERNGFPYPVYHDPGTPTMLDVDDPSGLESFWKWNFTLVSVWQSHLDPDDDVMWDVSPASIGNLPGYPDVHDYDAYRNFYDYFGGGVPSPGHALNPATGLPYEPQIVKRGDYARILAEYWADGPASVTPPGHWFKIMHDAMDHPMFERRWMGQGEILNDLEYDVKAHFVMGGSQHDAATTAWSIKGWYDYVRPVSAIRYMAERGQCSDPDGPNFHPAGLPLIPGHMELVEAGDPLAGENDEHVGKVKLHTWMGPPYIEDAEEDYAGVGWILAENWWPYQRPWFVTPPFAGYISGHSTYSSTAAQVMEMITGDPFFPGGMRVVHCQQNNFLEFEIGPSEDVYLQWATYRDASDQCSLSRIWGGIHPPMDDIAGRHIGKIVGADAVDLGNSLFNSQRPVVVSVSSSDQVLNIADIGSTFALTITYDRPMDQTVAPEVDFLVQDPLLEAAAVLTEAWTDEYNYVMVLQVLPSELRLPNIYMRVDQARGTNGMDQDVFLVAQPFIIDTDRPNITLVASPVGLMNDAVAAAGQLDVLISFNEPCDTNTPPVVALGGSGDPSSSMALNAAGSQWLSAQQYRARFDLSDAGVEIDAVELEVSNVLDEAGNEQNAHDAAFILAIDTRNPVLSTATVNNSMLALAHVGNSALQLTVVFDEPMNTSMTPDFSFPGENPLGTSLVAEPLNSMWLSATTYRKSYTLLNGNEEFFNITPQLVNFADAAGNAPTANVLGTLFTIDTKRPEVQAVLPAVPVVSDAQVGTGGFHVDITFPEVMNTTQPALVQLNGTGMGSTFSNNLAQSTWQNATTFRAVFNVTDQNVEVAGIGLTVNFAQDLSGNNQVAYTGTNVFSLDTRNPQLVMLTANTYTVDNSNTGSAGFMVLSMFDEVMEAGSAPTLTFSESLDGILTPNAGASAWINAFTYRSAFDVATMEANIGPIDVTVSLARDLALNPMQQQVHLGFFTIDLQLVGMDELTDGAGIVLFPNPIPAGEPLRIMAPTVMPDVALDILDMRGALVHRSYPGTLAKGINTLDLPAMASGMYQVRLDQGGRMHSMKLAIQGQ